jgi:hydrogenase expression/formation protein HypE
MTQELIREVFAKAFDNPLLRKMDDAAVFGLKRGDYALTTDSFVVDPIFFPGGDIGKLAVCGTINDLASCGAEPLHLTASFILEEGLPAEALKKIVASMSLECGRQGVAVVAGDTKVVPRGKADKVFINTSGLGVVRKGLAVNRIRPGDKILINGPIGQHGLSILTAREGFSTRSRLKSDCNSLWPIVKSVLRAGVDLRFMRDPTRGGVSGVCHEAAAGCGHSLVLEEKRIPASAPCRDLCDMLGLELLDIANEGKMLFFVADRDVSRALKALKAHPLGQQAAVIGEVLKEKKGRVYLKTALGPVKPLSMPVHESLPRIC